MKILITGASGYVGNALVEDLRGEHEIIATARNIDRIQAEGIEKHTLDITSAEQASEVIGQVKPDVVIHAAALPKRSKADADTFINTNVEGIRNVACATRDCSDAKFIMLSSGCAYKQEDGKIVSTDSTREMGNSFSKSKNLAEDAMLDVFADQPGRLAIVYPPVVLHESQPSGIISYALHDAKSNGTIINKVPDGHVNFVSHSKLSELMNAIAKDTTADDVQRYPITANRFSTAEFFEKLQGIFAEECGVKAAIRNEADPHIETMCAMDESAITALKPDFDWGNVDDDIRAIARHHQTKSQWVEKDIARKSSPGRTEGRG